MIVYNVTVKVELDVHDLWLKWMKEEHLPRVLETGCFTDAKMFRILEEDTRDGISYAMQYFAKNMTDYFEYKENHAARLQKEGLDMFPGKFQAFRTLLREV
ncbi:MAG: DUF4286 family protein [Chitinophagales bacterium]|nr:DUF4286 family protein [Chitinophagales bacterium]